MIAHRGRSHQARAHTNARSDGAGNKAARLAALPRCPTFRLRGGIDWLCSADGAEILQAIDQELGYPIDIIFVLA